MTDVENSILNRIGNTPLIELKRLAPEGSARVFLKIESENPTGSMKDRMALAMIEAAERDGRLKPGAPVVEYTGGSTGVSLAMVCAVKGYPLHIVSSDAFSIEKRRHMQALGADLTVVASDSGRMDAALTHAMIAEADRIRGIRAWCLGIPQVEAPLHPDGRHRAERVGGSFRWQDRSAPDRGCGRGLRRAALGSGAD